MEVSDERFLDVGLDFYFEPDTGLPQLQSYRVQQVWISPGLRGTRSGIGTVFCEARCQNSFDLPTLGTPHHHLLFAVNTAGVYVWDVRAVRARNRSGVPLADMDWAYRVYMVTNNPRRVYGDGLIRSAYQGDPYLRRLTIAVRQNGQTLAQQTQPPNPNAIYSYMVGFTQSGTVDLIAKLEGHLSRRIRGFALTGAHRVEWEFTVAGDINDDDVAVIEPHCLGHNTLASIASPASVIYIAEMKENQSAGADHYHPGAWRYPNECSSVYFIQPQDELAMSWHNGGANYTFVDGHAKWYRFEQTWTSDGRVDLYDPRR